MSGNGDHLDSNEIDNPFAKDRVRIGTSLRELMVRLWPYFMRQRWLFFSTLATVLAVAVASRLTITVFGMAIDHGILKQDRDVMLAAAIAYFLLEAGRTSMEFLQNYWFAKLGNRVLFELRDDLIRHTQRLPISYFDKTPAGRIVTRLTNDIVSLGELFTQGLISVFAAIVSLAAIVTSMLLISVRMTLITLLIAPPLVWLISRLTAKIMIALRESKAKIAAINAFVAENINGMKVLQLYGRVDRNTGKFQKLSAEYREQQMRTVFLYATLWPITSFFNGVSVAAALYAGGQLTLNGTVTTGAMIAFILHVRAFIDPMHVILEKYQVFQNSLSGAERVFTLMDEAHESGLDSSGIAPRLRGEIEFADLSFRYQAHLPNALDHINLHIKAGESVALVGRTGSGKSTTIALLQRLYDISGGKILIDGQPIENIARLALRRRIGVVQQDTFMFRGTIAENISLADPSITRERIERAAEGACLGDMLERQNGGLDAKVEERGANLSFGERQLIAFARILAFDPDILILDEATANIDSQTERLIQEATTRVRRGRTSLIIAHRISTIVDCDKIVVLDHGHIIEIGNHEELIAKNGVYQQLCEAQFKEAAAHVAEA